MKFSRWNATLFTLPVLLGLSSMAHSQTDPEIHILNPVGFVTPGQVEEIIAEISNPVDSNVVFEGLGGGGRKTGGSLMQGFDPRFNLRASMRLVEQPGLRPDLQDVNANAFPIYPGETARVVLFRLNIPDDALPGSDLILMELGVKLHTGVVNRVVEVYPDFNVARLVSNGGEGDLSIFDGIELENPKAGVLKTNLVVDFDYPSEVVAGESFELHAIITNRAETALTVQQAAIGPMASMLSWQGEHARSYRFVPAQNELNLSGESNLLPGESIQFTLGTFHYENEDFFDGLFTVSEFTLSVWDALGRHERIYPQVIEPVQVNVRYEPGSEFLYRPDEQPPLPLERWDLEQTGDALVVIDPNSGLEWLKITAGKAYTLEELLAETQPGGRFEGFSLASASQVEELVRNHLNSSGLQVRDYALYNMLGKDAIGPWQEFVRLFGIIPTANDTLDLIGMVNDDLPQEYDSTSQYTFITASITSKDPDSSFFMMSSAQGLHKFRGSYENRMYEYTGYWMVR